MTPQERDLIAHYEAHPQYYSPAGSRHWVRLLEEFAGTEYDTVLDIGCGDGRLGDHLPKFAVTGVDVSPTRIGIARTARPWGDWHCADLYQWLEECEESYDLAVAVEVLEHLDDPLRVIDAALRLAPVLVGSVPVNMPYEAHLQVYENEDALNRELQPEAVLELGQHWLVRWRRSTWKSG